MLLDNAQCDMVSTRVRLKKGKAVKRWKKGHSAASKPSANKHREAVKGALRSRGVFHKGADGSLLTKENVDIHEAAAADDDEERSSYSRSTTSTCYSFIETAHPVFHKVKKFWMSPLESHREVCAVLAAVSEVVKSKNGKESETEYFAALLSALQSAEDEQSVAAILLLLNIVMPEVSENVLQSQFTEISKLLMDKLSCYEKCSSTALLKSLVSCSSLLLSAQPGVVWRDPSTLHYLQFIINYTTHPKPKVRKAAHEGIAHMIQSGITCNNDVTTHPAAISLAKFCHNHFEQAGNTSTLHVLNLLKDTIPHMMPQAIKKICEKLLKLLLLGNTLMKSQCLQTFHGLFSRHTIPQGLTIKLNGQLISAMYDYQPRISDVQLVAAWTIVMETAHMRLMKFDKNICLAHLPKLIQSLMSMLLSPSPSSRDIICNSIKSLIEQCLQDCPNKEIIEACFRSVEVGLKFQYQSAWDCVLQVLGHFYRYLGNSYYSIMSESLVSLCELRNTAGFPCVDQLNKTIAEAVKSVGPRKILESIPLQLDPVSDTCNDWILLIMRDHVSNAELSYFAEHLLPVAMTIKSKAGELTNQNAVKAAMFRTIYSQVWDLLPAFCTSPIDVEKSFTSIARLLGEALKGQPLLRPTICRSLRLLIETTTNNSLDTNELSKYAKNYLPLLFNIYTESTDDSNNFILDCIKSYASITDPELLEKFVIEICSRFQKHNVKTQIQLTDLLTVLCDRVGVVLLGQLYNIIVSPWVKVEDSSVQKKGYLLLEKLMSCNSPSLERFLQDHVSNIQELLIEATATVKSAAKRLRMKCIHHFVHHVTPLNTEFLSRIIPEVMLSVKEVKEKTRSLAITILIYIGHCYDHKAIGEYFKLIVAGLAGSAHMISATIVSLTRLVYLFHDILSEEMLEELVKIVTTQLRSRCKEVVKSSLDFVKVIIGVLDKQQLLSYIDGLLDAVFSWDKTFQQHFHFKMKVILERLIKKLGYDIIESLVPMQHKKLIVHIHKMITKQQKKKEHKISDKQQDSKVLKTHKPSYEELLAGSDDEVRDQDDGGRWIKDDVDDPIDLMDHTALQYILASRPVSSKPVEGDFVTTEDGRLLIDEVEQSMMNTENKRKRKRHDDDEPTLDKESSIKKQKTVTIPGSQYRSQRAHGDMKRRGKPDPYAYIALNRQSLNKRKKHKTVSYYGALLRRAHTGSSRGRKQLARAKHKLKK